MAFARARASTSAVIRRYRLDVFALLVLPYLALVGRFWGVVDDAFISFRYARNFALGHGLRYNLGEHVPVEGYSNFLWVLISAVFELFHMDVTFWAPLLSVLCGVVLLGLVFDVLRRRLEVGLPVACLTTLSLGCFPPFAYWSTGGLETMPFALLVLVTFERLVLRRDGAAGVGAGVAGLLLALMRVEGIAWLVVLLVLALASRRIAGQRSLRPLLTCALIAGVGYAVYFVLRFAYYQLPWPNTVYAKTGVSAELLGRGGRYVLVYVLTFLTPALIVPGTLFALRRKRVAIGLPVAAMAWAFPAYAIVVTGDYMAMGRFLVPGLAFAAILFGWMLQDLAGTTRPRQLAFACAALTTIVVGLLPSWNINLIPESVRARFHFRQNTRVYRSEFEQAEIEAERVAEWTILGRALRSFVRENAPDEARPSYVVEAIGAVGYYSHLYIYDRNALVSPGATRAEPPPDRQKSPGHDRTVEPEFFLDREPTIFYARVASEPDKLARACTRALRMLRTAAPKQRLQEQYRPDLTRLPETDSNGHPFYLVTLLRLPAGADWRAAQDDFSRQVREILHGSGPPLP
jgi:arabinofuranosyltransferase